MLKNEIWVMAPKHLEELVEKEALLKDFIASGIDVHAAQRSAKEDQQLSTPYTVEDGVAEISINGPIMKNVPWFYGLLGIGATSTEDTRTALADAIADDEVETVLLNIDSPGGSISGLQALADDIYEARGQKRIEAYASGMAASAAYWIGSQADHFSASRGADIGSIGVYAVVEDSSEAFKNNGIEVHVVSSGGVKGASVPGTPFSDEARADLQRKIDDSAELFTDSVSRGRGIPVEVVQELASGKTWLGPTAKKHGLIDTVESEKQLLKRLQRGEAKEIASVEGAPKQEVIMTKENETSNALEAHATDIMARLEALETDKSSAELRASAAEARAEAAEASLAAVKGSQKQEILAQAVKDGRVAPAAKDAYAKLSEVTETEEFSTILANLPQVTRPDGEGATGKETDEVVASSDELKVAKTLGLTVEELRAASEIAGLRVDGSLVRIEEMN